MTKKVTKKEEVKIEEQIVPEVAVPEKKPFNQGNHAF